LKRLYFIRLGAGSGLSALVATLRFCPCNSLALPRQHHLELELSDRPHHIQDELACRAGRVDVEVLNAEGDLLLRESLRRAPSLGVTSLHSFSILPPRRQQPT
jgi:hypothetical protein